MKQGFKYSWIVLVLFASTLFCQNETKYWYFGNQAGLNFNTNPPTILTNNAMNSWGGGTGSISDANGNLLFYTNGAIIYDKTHAIMANGSGLVGNSGSGQGALIVKQPGSSTLYYIFCSSGSINFYYSIVDVSLASGNGSVTVKNALISGSSNNGGKIAGTRHCNGVDVWILTQDWNSSLNNTYRAYLLTAAGISTNVVTSSFNSTNGSNNWNGSIKISPNGKKFGVTNFNGISLLQNNFIIYDFDNVTGAITNSVSLWSGGSSSSSWGWGCEFSPDGTKFYGSIYSPGGALYQWDLCAGSATAISASQITIATSTAQLFNLQLASDGKIYVSRSNQPFLGVINNPNASGTSCNYVDLGQSISPKTCWYGLPNFISSNFVGRPLPAPFTYTTSNMYGCQSALFNTTYTPGITTVGCASTGYSLTGLQWDFGDLPSGANNISTAVSPIHAFTNLGTYTVQLVLYYSCGGGTDTLKQVVNISQPCISVSSTSITCAHLGSATVTATGGIGPFSYTWMPTGQTSAIAASLTPGAYTLSVYDQGNNFTYTATTVFTSSVPLTGSLNYASSVTCHGASTASASVTNFAGGSGTVSYAWDNGTTVYTQPSPTLSAGIWSLTVTDSLTGCQVNQTFFISQPPALNLILSSNSPTSCATKSATLSGVNSGGIPHMTGPAYSYTWTGGPLSHSRTVSQSLAGTYVYTLNSLDSLNCFSSNTIAIDFIPNPTLALSSVSICPFQTGLLTVSGASTYTWATTTSGPTFTDNPLITKQYSVTGMAQSCTTSASAFIIIKAVPFPIFNHNSPVCDGANLNFAGFGGASFNWDGPLGFSSSAQSSAILSAAPAASGIYTLTVTGANSCTASVTKTITVNPTPTLSATGSTVCTNQSITLSASSFAGASFLWKGPLSYSSAVQNPTLSSPAINMSGTYTVKVTSAQGCTSSASAGVTVTAMPVATLSSNSPLCFGSTLSLSANGGLSYSWTGPDNFSSALQNPFISNITLPAGGTYSLQITTGPCVNNKTRAVVVYALPSFTLSSSSPVCQGKTLNLYGGTVSNAASYLWQGPAGFIKLSQDAFRDSSVLQHSGIYSLTLTDNNTCKNTQTLSVSIEPNPALSLTSATVCLNQPATLKASGAVSYLWSGPGFFQSSQAQALVPVASNSLPSTYTVVGTAANSCTSVATASLSTLSLPLPSINVFPKSRLCLNEVFTLQGQGGAVYEWTGPAQLHLSGQTRSIAASSANFAGTYTLIVTDERGCSNSTTTIIYLDGLPVGNLIGNKLESCVPFRTDFKLQAPASTYTTATGSWMVNGKNYTDKIFSADFLIPGNYTVSGVLTDTLNYCSSTMSFVIRAYPLPAADFEFTPQEPFEEEEVFFTNTSKGEQLKEWSWYFKTDKVDTSSKEHPAYTFKQPGAYPIAMVVKNKWGCADTSIKNISVSQDLTIYVPNAFTPNGDGLNEIFLPVLRGVKKYDLKVFNRWGTKLFETSELTTGWPGEFNGEPCKNDVYTWKITISTLAGEMKTLSGYVLLNR